MKKRYIFAGLVLAIIIACLISILMTSPPALASNRDQPIDTPGSLWLMGAGVAALAWFASRKK